jgi:hypothetical protein
MRCMSDLTLPRKTWSVSIVIALLVTLPLVAVPQVARAADLGDEPSSGAKSGGDSVGQADDADKPKDPSLLDKNAADAAAAKQKKIDTGPPFYEKWQFWVIAGAVVVGAVAAIWATQEISHQIGGGDVRPCNMTFTACFGDGH